MSALAEKSSDPKLGSSALLIGPHKLVMPQLEIDFCLPENDVVEKTIGNGAHEVIVFPIRLLVQTKFFSLMEKARADRPFLQLIAAIADGRTKATTPTDSQMLSWHQKLGFSKILPSLEDARLEAFLVECLERSRALKQEQELQSLLEEQNLRLRSLHFELEDRVDKRQRFLEESLRKTAIANSRWQKLREALVKVHQSLSVGEMEKSLMDILRDSLSLTAVRIFFHPQDQSFAMQFRSPHSLSTFQAPLLRLQQVMGSVFFIREPKMPFHREETDFLLRISEGLALSIDRLSQLQQSENLREQWQATFNAIKDPVLLLNSHFDVIQANSSARPKGGGKKKCYELLFDRTSQCLNCTLGQSFRVESKSEIFEVVSHASQDESGPIFVNIYHDITNQTRMERKILETARLAELGTIGSSIAHELNNPLGGILSFVQLMKMDLKPDDALKGDLDEMEKGVKRCRDIIENLLGFTRNPQADVEGTTDIKEVVTRAFKIIELQAKNQNLQLTLQLPKEKMPFEGHFNLLAQAVQNVLQLAVDAILETSAMGQIDIRSSVQSKDYWIEILDNGPASQRRNSLHYTIASQIVHEQGGILELFSTEIGLTKTTIVLPRPHQ